MTGWKREGKGWLDLSNSHSVAHILTTYYALLHSIQTPFSSRFANSFFSSSELVSQKSKRLLGLQSVDAMPV